MKNQNKTKKQLIQELEAYQKINDIDDLESIKPLLSPAITHNIINHSFDGILIFNDSGKIIYNNPAVLNNTGYKTGDLKDNSVLKFIYARDIRKILTLWKKNKTKRFVQYEIKIKCKNNLSKSFLCNQSLVNHKNQNQYCVIFKDNSEQKELIEAKEFAQNIIESSLGMIVSADKHRRITGFNKAAQKTFGYSENEIIGKQVQSLYANDEDGKRIGGQMDLNGKFVGEVLNIKKDGSIFPCLISASVLKDQNGNTFGVVGNSRDISHEKKIEKKFSEYRNHLETEIESRTIQLRHAKRQAEIANQAKSEFIANMSYEFRNPMQSILGFAKLGSIKSQKDASEKLHEFFQDIYASGQRLQNLLNDFLDLSKLEAGKMIYHFKQEKLSILILKAINASQQQADEKDISIQFNNPKFDDTAVIDNDKTFQVISNLIANAINNSDPNDAIVIKLSLKSDAFIISVKDSGKDLSRNDLLNIFDIFTHQDKNITDNSGLGLAVSKKIITDHSGKIWAEQNPKGGTNVQLQIPRFR